MVEGGTLSLLTQTEFMSRRFQRQDVAQCFAQAAREICGRDLRVQVSVMQAENRQTRSLEDLKQFPEQFGIPVLFPPNRIADGRFLFEGRECRLPVNETAMHNHLHGLAVGKPWELLSADQNMAEFQFAFSARDPEYAGFPFAFTLRRQIELTPSGLRDRMTVTNHGEWNMPLGLGYHTTSPAPLKMRISTEDHQIEIGERYLPTGRLTEWRDFDPPPLVRSA